MSLVASHLTRRFGGRVAVDDVSFELAAGEIFALLGPNGAGKTTTLRMLAGLIEPSSGSVHVDGDAIERTSAARLRGRIGFLTESPGLWDRLTVRDNLLVYARLYGIDNPAAQVDRSLALFDIADRERDRAAELSKGLKQRVALARALLHDPDIVLLDEPTSGLDPESARDVRALILRLRDDRRAVLLSTHNLDEVDRVATRVAVLRTRLIASDTPAALRARLFGARVRIVVRGDAGPFERVLRQAGATDVAIDGGAISIGVSTQAPETPSIVRALVDAGAGIESVTREEPSLEDVYLRLLDAGPASAAAAAAADRSPGAASARGGRA
jgi:ABC-2 type transport system ATP-binding protein